MKGRNTWDSPDPPKLSSSSLLSVARFRPISDIERDGADSVQFSLSRVFSPEVPQAVIYSVVGAPLLSDILDGYNGTIFAYGQTGSGKTYTMSGPDIYDEEAKGIVPRAAEQVFHAIEAAECGVEFAVKCSVLEIYKEKVFDLLDDCERSLKIKESATKGIHVDGATALVAASQYVVTAEELMDVLELGASNRSVAVTRMNKASSRSHEIIQIEVTQRLTSGHEKRGLLNLIDLAGSEKASAVSGLCDNFEEMKKINLSLSALGKVIHSLVTAAEHIPYRDSKLTRLLQESLSGNFKTSLIVTCSPHPKNVEETLSSLRFGERAGALKTKVRKNVKECPELLIQHLQEELLRCQAELRTLKISPEAAIPGSASLPTPRWGSTDADTLDVNRGKCHSELFGSFSASEAFSQEQRKSSRLQQQSEELRTQLRELEQKQEKRKSRIAELERSLVDMNESSYAAIFNYSEAVRKNEELEGKVEVLRKQNKTLTDQVQRLEMQLAAQGDVSPSANTAEFVEHSIDETQIFGASSGDRSPSPSLCHREFPLDLPRLAESSPYTACSKLEVEFRSDAHSDAVCFLMRNQLIQASFINAGLSQAYQSLEWRLKLLESKLDLSEKTNKRLTEDIKRQNELFRKLQTAYSHVRTGRDSMTPAKKLSFVRRTDRTAHKVRSTLRTSPQRDQIRFQSPSPVDFRPGTAMEGHLTSNTASYADVDDAGRFRTVRNSLDARETYNAQLLNLLSAKTAEVNMYISIIQEMEKMVFTSHKLERAKWMDYLSLYKSNCEAELLRRQTEIGNLNKVLAYWVERYTEMQNTIIGGMDTTWKFEQSLECEAGLAAEEDPKAASWLVSEDSAEGRGASFLGPDMEALGRSRGDMSPISPEED